MSCEHTRGSYVDDIERTLFKNRELHVVGAVDPSQAYVLVKSLRYLMLDNKKKPIRVYLNTPGGTIVDGLAIYDQMRAVAKVVPVEIVTTGACMSMGVIILQAATRRLSLPNTRFLLHELQTRTGGSLSALKDEMGEAERLQSVLDDILSERTGQDTKKLRKLFERRDYFLDAKEAQKYNIIDTIVEA